MIPQKLFNPKCLHPDRDVIFKEDLENFYSSYIISVFTKLEKIIHDKITTESHNKSNKSNILNKNEINNQTNIIINTYISFYLHNQHYTTKFENPLKSNNLYSLDDIEDILINENLLSYSEFKLVWKESQMSLLHYTRYKEENPNEYYQTLFKEVQDYLFPINDKNFISKIFSIYCLYSLFYTQPYQIRYKINVVVNTLKAINLLLEYFKYKIRINEVTGSNRIDNDDNKDNKNNKNNKNNNSKQSTGIDNITIKQDFNDKSNEVHENENNIDTVSNIYTVTPSMNNILNSFKSVNIKKKKEKSQLYDDKKDKKDLKEKAIEQEATQQGQQENKHEISEEASKESLSHSNNKTNNLFNNISNSTSNNIFTITYSMILRLYNNEAFKISVVLGMNTILLNKYGLPLESKKDIYTDYKNLFKSRNKLNELKDKEYESKKDFNKTVIAYNKDKSDAINDIKELYESMKDIDYSLESNINEICNTLNGTIVKNNKKANTNTIAANNELGLKEETNKRGSRKISESNKKSNNNNNATNNSRNEIQNIFSKEFYVNNINKIKSGQMNSQFNNNSNNVIKISLQNDYYVKNNTEQNNYVVSDLNVNEITNLEFNFRNFESDGFYES